jgi:class 3 adenylate cyclase
LASDITEWLEGLALSKYASAFAEAEIDLAALPYITEQDLKDLGLPIGPRRKVLAAINDVRSRETELSENKLSGAATDSERETQAQQGAERRQLTALFADVVGSTAMAQTMNPEDLRTVLRSFQQVSTNAIARYEGHIAKFMGDGLLAYFGCPGLMKTMLSAPYALVWH